MPAKRKQTKRDGGNIRTKNQSGGVNISGSAQVSGDIVGRNKSVTTKTIQENFSQWQAVMEKKIDDHPNLSPNEKQGLKNQISEIQKEAAKGESADLEWLEKLINTLGVMAADILDVAITTLVNPLLGIGLVIRKIGNKAKLERQGKAS